jgi:hypothetical protein
MHILIVPLFVILTLRFDKYVDCFDIYPDGGISRYGV